jgi:rhamnogalacturonan endolyase
MTEPEKIPDGKYIKSLNVNDSENSADWSIQTGIDSGKEVFGDRQCKFKAVPDQLKDAEWIRTACDSKKFTGEEASFKAGADITAFVGVDSRAEANASSWLAEWTKTNLTLTDDGNPIVTYNVYKKDVKNGEEIKLGAINMNNAVNYVVMAKPYVSDEVYVTTSNTSTTTAASSTEAVTTTTVVKEVLYGDANCDGSVTVSDAVAILQYIGNKDKFPLSPEGMNNADVYHRGDGITAYDAISIQKLDAGMIESLPES